MSDKRKILRILADAGEELRQHLRFFGRESDERLRARLTAAGLTPEMTAFLIDLADRAEVERQKQRAKREERRKRQSKFWQARAAYQDPRLVQEELFRQRAERQEAVEMANALIDAGCRELLKRKRAGKEDFDQRHLSAARERLRRAYHF